MNLVIVSMMMKLNLFLIPLEALGFGKTRGVHYKNFMGTLQPLADSQSDFTIDFANEIGMSKPAFYDTAKAAYEMRSFKAFYLNDKDLKVFITNILNLNLNRYMV